MVSFSRPAQKGGLLSALVTAVLLFSIHTSARPHKHRHSRAAVDMHTRDVSTYQPGFKNVGYYVNWAIYGRNWPPQNIQSEQLTHVLYAFAGLDNKTGAANWIDAFADVQKKFDGDDVADESGANMYGNLKQLYLHKKKNRNLKTLLSIGGWTLRTYFAPALAHEEGRKTFAKTSVQLLKDHGFDGLDIDWEYPNSTKEAQDLVDTCREFRAELDAYSLEVPGQPHFLLTLAVPAGPEHFQYFDMPALAPYVDFVNLMGYDYAGSFSSRSGHMSNIFPSADNPLSTNYSTQAAMDFYLDEAVWDRSKLTLGLPLYGRSFANTTGLGQPFDVPTDGSWENGAWDYKALYGNASFGDVSTDMDLVASWSYNSSNGYMASYDTPDVAAKKAEYIDKMGLSGAMWWELSGDLPVNGQGSLLRTVTDYFVGCKGLEQSMNVLDYPCSKYENLRNGMPGE